MKKIIKPFIPPPLRSRLRRMYNLAYGSIATVYYKSIWNLNYKESYTNIDTIKEIKSPISLLTSKDKDAGINLMKNLFPESQSKIIQSADTVCNHIFDLLGSGPKFLGVEINWHLDFKVNRTWALIHPKAIDVDELNKPSDIKIPWELSRCQHFVTLGQAYWLTQDEKYAYEFKSSVESWIKSNPYKLGVNWLCTMDVAIRVANWILSWHFFKNSSVFDEKFMNKFLNIIHLHGKHIINNLENKGKVTTNHYLSDIVGLLYIAVNFPEFDESRSWKEFAIKELKKEMKKQVNPDGMDFEGSTCYHRLVLELFFFSALLTITNDDSFDKDYEKAARKIFGNEYVDRLCKMFKFVLYALKPNGMMPQIGDNDNGRLFILSEKEILDMRYLLNLGAIFFNEPKFKINEFGFTEDAFWVFGEEGYKRWESLKVYSIKNLKSKDFPDSGIYVIRDDLVYVIIHLVSNGQGGIGGHSHNDVLSFELNVNGKDFIVDPGSCCYTCDYKKRNLFRGSAYHNTVVVDGEGINRFKEKEIFGISDYAKPKVLKWETGKDYNTFVAEHYGYKRLYNPVIHKREMIYFKKERKIKVKDRFTGEGKHKFQWNLILSPEIKKDLTISSKELQWQKEDTFYSPEYGAIKKTKKLTVAVETTIPYETEFEMHLAHGRHRRY